jgi:hypothetical protein
MARVLFWRASLVAVVIENPAGWLRSEIGVR